MSDDSADVAAAAHASASECVVEQLLAESEALLASIGGASSASPPPLSPSSFVSCASLSATEGTAPVSASSHPAPHTKRRRNSTRDRMQGELQFLRKHVAELEVEMKTKKARLLIVRDGGGGASREREQPVSAWQRLAQRQKGARAIGERENRSLQSRVAAHVELIRGIRDLLVGHQSASSQRRHMSNRMLIADREDAAEFAALKRDSLSAFAASDRMLAENAHDAMSMAIDDNVFSDTFDEHEQRFVSRLASTRVFPFDVHSTSNAMWRAIFSLFDWSHLLFEETAHTGGGAAASKTRITAALGFHVVERSDDIYAVKHTVTLSLGDGADVVVRVKDVITRFASDGAPGKTVFVWQTALTSSDKRSGRATPTSQGPPQVRGSGWITFHKQPGTCSSSVMRSVFEFHTETRRTDRDDDGDDDDDENVQLMKAWVTLGGACMDGVSLEIDKGLL